MIIDKIHISQLNSAEYNPRKELKAGDKEYEKLKRSIAEFGYVEPIIWNKVTGNIVGGHQRLAILKDTGQEIIDCVVVELEPQKEKALNIALNKVQGDWDSDKLTALITDLDDSDFDITLTGFELSEMLEMIDGGYSNGVVQDNFDTEKGKEQIESQGVSTSTGDIYLLGEHRLMCGNCSNAEDIAKLMNGSKVQMAFANAPIVNKKEYTANGIQPWRDRLNKSILNTAKVAPLVCFNIADMYTTGTAYLEPTYAHALEAFTNAGIRPIWTRVWKKQGKSFGGTSYHLTSNKPIPQYEYISAFGEEGNQYNDQEYTWISAFAGHSYKFVKRLTKDERKKWGYAGIWDINYVSTDGYPIDLVWRCVKMHSDKGGIVFDPFCGSGTAIIACEQSDRVCYSMDIDPTNVELTVKRWEEFTGNKAVKIC